jgi:hypothetical protein
MGNASETIPIGEFPEVVIEAKLTGTALNSSFRAQYRQLPVEVAGSSDH